MAMSQRSTASGTKLLQRVLRILATGLLLTGAIGGGAAQGGGKMMRGPIPTSAAEQLGLPSLNGIATIVSARPEVRIWVWHLGDPEDYLLRLWQTDGHTDGQLPALSQDASGIHSRRSSLPQDWDAVLRDLEARSVWSLRRPWSWPFIQSLCISSTNLVIESHRNWDYRRVEFEGVRDYHGDAEAIYDYVYALVARDAQIASLNSAKRTGCS